MTTITKKIFTKNKLNKILIIGAFLFSVFSSQISSASIESNPNVPEIIPRTTWGADETQMTWPIEYAKVEKIIVHHTASTTLVADTDGSGQYKSMVNNIYKYHTSSKSWTDQNGTNYTGFGDIGYNYLIDPNGNIYEGRKGGNGVIGGHASGFNSGSVGISIIGNYQDGTAGQTNTSLDTKVATALAKLIGWIAANNGMNLDTSSNFYGKTIDGMVGHKDVAATLCPGNIIYSELSSIQTQAVLYAKEYQKYIYQIQGSSAVYIISGGYKTKFSSKNALPITYQSREVQYVSKAQLDAYQYKDRNILPDGTLVNVNGEGTIYYLENSKKRPLSMDEAGFLKLGFKADEVITISESELDFYETGNIIKIAPEGTLIKDSKNSVYFIENGKKRLFTSATLFNKLGYSWAKVKTDNEADYYMNGDVMCYENGTLVKSKDSSSVYLIEDGKKRIFTSGTLFEKLGYKWSGIVTAENSELSAYANGANVTYPNGTLIRGAGTSTVYLVDNGQKREITSATLFSKLGYSFDNVIEIPKESLFDYTTGSKAVYPNGTLIKSQTNPAVYRIIDGKKEEFTSLNVFNANGAKWSNVIEISQNEINLYVTAGTVKYPEGSLLKSKDGEKIYIIKSGQATWIETAEDFVKAGYKWTDVFSIDYAEMKLYVTEDSVNDNVIDNNTTTVPSTPTTPANSTTPISSTAEPNMRVAITNSTADSVSITANGNYKIEYRRANDEIYKTVQKENGQITEVPFFDWDNYIRFIPESDDVIMQVTSYSDPSYDKKTDDNRFRGVLELRYSTVSKKMWVIEDVALEDYLNGIAEATTYSEPEYLKAFSTIARTYAMYYIQKGGKHTGEPFYLKNSRNGNGNDQVYRGYDLEMRAPNIVSANEVTEGQIIEFLNKPIVAAYSSDSGGITKSGCEALSKNYCASEFDYLDGGVEDPAGTVHNSSKIAASHGAGMSAVGAYQMATEGSDWQSIIKYYYLGVDIDKYY
ncbi:MAG: N-acetylmuramoyl-L-alanine amidase [Candidatus Paceibacterota bacterium]